MAHVAYELLQQKAGIKLNGVPYRGGAPMVTDLLGGHHFEGLRPTRAAEHATAYSRNPRSAACPDVRNDLKCGIPTAGEYPPENIAPASTGQPSSHLIIVTT